MAAHSTGLSRLRGASFSTSIRSSRRDGFRWTGPRDDERRELHKLKRELRRLEHLDEGRFRTSASWQSDSATDFTGSRTHMAHDPSQQHQPGYREEPPDKPHWQLHREALKEKFPDGWNPPRKVSRGEMNTIRRLHNTNADHFSTPALADQFKISAEAVRRILRSKFRTDAEVEEERVGDALLREAELGEYERPSSLSRQPASSRYAVPKQDDELELPERTAPVAQPLQEGFDVGTSPVRSKWVSKKRRGTSTGQSSSAQEHESEAMC